MESKQSKATKLRANIRGNLRVKNALKHSSKYMKEKCAISKSF